MHNKVQKTPRRYCSFFYWIKHDYKFSLKKVNKRTSRAIRMHLKRKTLLFLKRLEKEMKLFNKKNEGIIDTKITYKSIIY